MVCAYTAWFFCPTERNAGVGMMIETGGDTLQIVVIHQTDDIVAAAGLAAHGGIVAPQNAEGGHAVPGRET